MQKKIDGEKNMKNKSVGKKIQYISAICGTIALLVVIFSAANIMGLWVVINEANNVVSNMLFEINAVEGELFKMDSAIQQSFLTESLNEKNEKLKEAEECADNIKAVLERAEGDEKGIWSALGWKRCRLRDH